MIYNELKERGTGDFAIELHHIDKNHTRYEMSSHLHSEIEIIRILKGTLKIRLNNNDYAACAGDVLFVNSETVHGAFPEDCVYECIVFHIDFLSIDDYGWRFFVERILNHEYLICEYITKDNELTKAVNLVFESMKNKSPGYKFLVVGALYRLFGHIIDNHLYRQVDGSEITHDKNSPKLKKVLSFIRSNYDRQITLDDMAEAAGMSPKYFCYFFRNMTSKTPVEYLNNYRIEKSSRKLLNTEQSVTDIAFSCGFNDLSYFIKTFKEQKGVTPSKFRKS